MTDRNNYKCSFCGKSQEMVRKLIAGPGVYICDECVELCTEIVEEELGRKPGELLSAKVYVVVEDNKVQSAVIDPSKALGKVFEASKEASVQVFDGFSGDLIETLDRKKVTDVSSS